MRHRCLHAALAAACLVLPSTAAAAETCGEYAAELAVMAGADQALRNRVDHLDPESREQQRLASHIALVDRTNTQRLKALIVRCGWPSKAAHGEQAPHHAWLVTQHADHDLAFQKQVLALTEQAATANGERLDRSFAYLDDRIAVAEKRPQRYGTQMRVTGDDHCALEFAPFDKRALVEARRAQLNLPPLESYRRMVLDMQKCPTPGPLVP